jgi:hypothetical protein
VLLLFIRLSFRGTTPSPQIPLSGYRAACRASAITRRSTSRSRCSIPLAIRQTERLLVECSKRGDEVWTTSWGPCHPQDPRLQSAAASPSARHIRPWHRTCSKQQKARQEGVQSAARAREECTRAAAGGRRDEKGGLPFASPCFAPLCSSRTPPAAPPPGHLCGPCLALLYELLGVVSN